MRSLAGRRRLGLGRRVGLWLCGLLCADHAGGPFPHGDDSRQRVGSVKGGRLEGVGVAELDSPRSQRDCGPQLWGQVQSGVLDQAAQIVDVVSALERDVARGEDCLERLLDRLLREEASDMIGPSWWSTSARSPASSPTALASSASATSCSSRFDKHSPLEKCGVKHGAPSLAPLLDLRLAVDEHVDRSAQIVQRAAQTHHLGVPVGHVRLDDEEVEVATSARIAAGVRAEQDHSYR